MKLNQQLSERRADSVRDFLAQQGVPGSSISGAHGFGIKRSRWPATKPWKAGSEIGEWSWW